MSGHSKWANIKHRKAKGDAARGKIFTKIGREIAVAVKSGGADPEANSKLKDVIAKAKANNMPNDNIARGIKKAAGELGLVNYEDMLYEGYGIGGSAVLVETLTDNKTRTAGDVRHFFDKYGGSLGTTNCVSFMFQRKGLIILERGIKTSEDAVFEDALEAGASDVITSDDAFEVYTAPSDYFAVKDVLEKKYIVLSSETAYYPNSTVKLDAEQLVKFQKMLEIFEDCDDVQNVYHNVELPEEEEE